MNAAGVVLLGILLWSRSTHTWGKCSYSFVVNQVDPTSCPCLQEEPHHSKETSEAPSWQADPSKDNIKEEIQHFETADSKLFTAAPTDNNHNTVKDGGDTRKQDSGHKYHKLHTIEGGEQLKYEFNRLASTMKDLEIRVYRESVQNRELKNTVIRQEQTLKDYKYLVQRLKQTMTRQKISQIREKELLTSEIVDLKESVDALRDTLHKQDYFLKTLEKNTHDLREHLTPGTRHSDVVQGNSKTKVIPVESTSDVTCDGLSRNATKYKDCEELYQRGHRVSGVYYIKPTFTPCPIPVYCEMGLNGSGWILIQRRLDGKVDFNRNWNEYRSGFGDLNHEFWLGNNNIFLFTNQASYRLRVDMWDFNNTHQYATYLYFTVAGERDKYRLMLYNHSGSVNDGLQRHNGMMFSTKDEDNDNWKNYHCAKEWSGGWWYNNCWFTILNGKYYNSPTVKFRGISWNEWKKEQLKRVEMKISPTEKHRT